ncbi:methyltransferase domain-containing protein [Leucobacter sp. CSA1]|uniref:Methyltransferase domain-containing protein n=1 Tax=Leucobacter chromiisoli TaxID=2796471 RepID=A0A934Q424_9MICO|nr:methyltransferase domain-containing protein [Leucobacter chromiisoli]MBK0417989.1 methyltransferase domain-containing protein [Leucobacter chromiisoli]
MADAYTHGHHASVLRSHTWRTAENSAAYLIPRLRPGMRVLDVGSGPGTITADLAELVAPGRVVGVDASEEVVGTARRDGVERDLANLEFTTGDAYALEFADASFDVVHAHQVLQHVGDPVAMLREMRRVTAAGGVVAARDVDYEGVIWSPGSPELSEWLDLYLRVHRGVSGEPAAGRHLKAWARRAGFGEVACSASLWLFEADEDRAWWGGMWAERAVASAFADNAIRLGLADRAKLERISAGWQRWAEDPDGWLLMPHAEVLATAE